MKFNIKLINTDYPNVTPEHLGAFERYVNHKIPLGSFGMALMENNLSSAVFRADDNNIEIIPELVMFIYHNLPMEVHGSAEKVKAFLSSPN